MKLPLINHVFSVFLTLNMMITSIVSAQGLDDLKIPIEPLILKTQGSFYMGGEAVEQSFNELGSFGPGSTIMVNQMYVEYMLPAVKETKLPVVMIHGMALTGKTWETTPDGRMGWDEYFVRNGHPVYVVDQVARGRSGFNQALSNNVGAEKLPPKALKPARCFADEFVWPNFRMGLKKNEPFEVSLFPITHMDELAKQGVPDLSYSLPDYSDTHQALSDLAIGLNKTLLISHSQSGFFPMQAALINPEGIAGIVSLEPGGCPVDLDELQLKTLSEIHILFIFGDYLETPTGISHSWQKACEQCETFTIQVNALGGTAKLVRLADEGINGNSHIPMQDLNHFEIVDRTMEWVNNINYDQLNDQQ